VVTLEPCRLLMVPQVGFRGHRGAQPRFANHFINKLIRQVPRAHANVRSLALMDAYGRIARVLLESAVKKDGLHYVPERLTQATRQQRRLLARDGEPYLQGPGSRRLHHARARRIVIQREPRRAGDGGRVGAFW
jgi:hypothetical protein